MIDVPIKEVFNNIFEHTDSADSIVVKFESDGGESRAAKAGLSGHIVIDMGNEVYIIGGKEYERGGNKYRDYIVTSSEPIKVIGAGIGIGEMYINKYINHREQTNVYFGDAYIEITRGLFEGICGAAYHIDRPDRVIYNTDVSSAFSHSFDVSLYIKNVSESRSIDANNLFANCDSVVVVNVTECSLNDVSLNHCFENNHADGIDLVEIKKSQIGISSCKGMFSDANIYTMTIDGSSIDIKCDSRYIVNSSINGQIEILDISNSTINLSVDEEYRHINSNAPFWVDHFIANNTIINNIEAFKNMLKYTHIEEVVTDVPEIKKAIDDVKKELAKKLNYYDDDFVEGEYVRYMNNACCGGNYE